MTLRLTLKPPHPFAYYRMEAEGQGVLFAKHITHGSLVYVPRVFFDQDWMLHS